MVASSLHSSVAIFAAGGDFGWVLIALASFAVWVYNQIKKANEEKAKEEKAKEEAKKQGRPPQPSPPPPRTQQSGGQQPPVRGPRQGSRPQPETRGARTDRPVPARQGSPGGTSAQGEGVAGHVRRYLDDQQFEQRAESLGQLTHLSTGVDEHVHEAFDHEVRTITDRGEATEGDEAAGGSTATMSAPLSIGDMLTDPDNLRNAIILQEILRLPKWD